MRSFGHHFVLVFATNVYGVTDSNNVQTVGNERHNIVHVPHGETDWITLLGLDQM